MASGSKPGLAKGGLALSMVGGILLILGVILVFWGPKNTPLLKESLWVWALRVKFWYLFFIPIFGIVCMGLAGSSYISETRGTGVASGILAFAAMLINIMFMIHNSYLTFGGKDIVGYFKNALPYLRLGWFIISFGSFMMIIGGSCLSAAFKKPRAVKMRDEPDTFRLPTYTPAQKIEPTEPQPRYQPAQRADAPATEEPPEDKEEEETVKERVEPGPPPEDTLPPPKDEFPPPPPEDSDDDEAEEEPEDEGEDEEEPVEEEKPAEPPAPPIVPVPAAVPVAPPVPQKLNIEKGYNHLILEESPRNAFEAMKDLVGDTEGTKGLCMSTMFPAKMVKEYGLENVDKIWISHSTSNEFTVIDPKRLEFEITRAISNFMKDKSGIILIDGLEYLVVENGFENVLKFLKKVCDLSSVNNCTLIISVNPNSLSSDQLTVLKKDFDRVHDTTKMPAATQSASPTAPAPATTAPATPSPAPTPVTPAAPPAEKVEPKVTPSKKSQKQKGPGK